MHLFGRQSGRFYSKNVNFKKSLCNPHRLPNNISQTKNRDDSLRNAACSAKNTEVLTDHRTNRLVKNKRLINGIALKLLMKYSDENFCLRKKKIWL